MKTVRRVVALLAVALLLGGCWPTDDPKPEPKPEPVVNKGTLPKTSTTLAKPEGATTVPDSPAPTSAPEPGPAPSAGGTPNVIAGVVRDEQGDPVAGAKIRIAGYTGKPNGLAAADTIKDAVTNSRGEYRLDVPSGLYGVSGTADVSYDGKTYKSLYLHPADGNCDKQLSDRGITKDFVLRLRGLQQCWPNPDPKNAGYYSGASVLLYPQGTVADDARLTLTLTPTAKLADGSSGKPVTFTRPYAALRNGFGPLETTSTLHDIPLGRYRLSGTAVLPDGSRLDLRFAPNVSRSEASAVTALDVSFPALEMLPYGIGTAEIAVYTTGGGGAPAPAPAPAPTPEPSPEPTSPPEPKTCYSPHVGQIPC